MKIHHIHLLEDIKHRIYVHIVQHGYSYFEYQLKGTIDRKFTEESDWIKIIGRLAKGNDASSYYQDYYHLEVLSLEVMNEKGQTTISN